MRNHLGGVDFGNIVIKVKEHHICNCLIYHEICKGHNNASLEVTFVKLVKIMEMDIKDEMDGVIEIGGGGCSYV